MHDKIKSIQITRFVIARTRLKVFLFIVLYNYILDMFPDRGERDSFGLPNTKECSMTYRQSKTFSLYV